MADYEVNGKNTKVGDKVIFTDPWHGKHGATITALEPKNGSHHTTLETDGAVPELPDGLSDEERDHRLQWFQGRSGKFMNVAHHVEGVPYSWDHVSEDTKEQ